MRELVTFSVAVKPLPRPALVPNGHGGIRYMHSAEYKAYKAVLRKAAEEALPAFWTPYDGPVEIFMVAQFVRPKTRAGEHWHVVTPDNDNLHKPIQDALTGLVFSDDRTVSASHLAKVLGGENRVTCRVVALDRATLDDSGRAFQWPAP